MNQKPCQFYSFLQAVRGNWRNALFIRCSGSLCPMIRQASCEGFLMAADASCQPIFARLGIEALALKVQGMRITDIAALYQVPPSHVGAWISRSLEKLRNDPDFLTCLL